MGGYGSGRHQYARTATVGESRTLEVNRFTDAVDHPGHAGTIRWGPEDDPDATIAFAMLPENTDADRATAVRVSYTVTPPRGTRRWTPNCEFSPGSTRRCGDPAPLIQSRYVTRR
jgi:hypothetical protein